MKEPWLVFLLGMTLFVIVLRMVRAYFFARRVSTGSACLPIAADDRLTSLVADVEKSGKVREAIRTIGQRAPGIKSPSLRSAYHCAAGYLAISRLKRPGLAVGFYLKALRAYPTCIEALEKLQEILAAQKRLRRLERTYWEVLGRLDDSEAGTEMWFKCWSGLTAIYSTSPRTIRRADAIRKMLSVFDEDGDEHDSQSSVSSIVSQDG
jgi:hypothetical protein